MTPFEFVFGLISIITSLALTHLTAGVVGLIRHDGRVRFSWRHACWTWVAFALVIANWAAFWQARTIEAWPFHLIAINLAFMISLYAFCALVIPDVARGDEVDLKAFHERDGRRYISAHILFAMLACIYNAVGAATVIEWLHRSSFAGLALLLSGIALIARPLWIQRTAATGIAVLAAFFLISLTQVLPG